MNSVVVAFLAVGVLNCGGAHPRADLGSETKAANDNAQPAFDDSWQIKGELLLPDVFHAAGDVQKRCSEGISSVRALRDQLVNGQMSDARTPLVGMNEIDAQLDGFLPQVGLMANVHPDKAVRDAAEKCTEDADALVTELSLDTEIFRVLSEINPAELSPLAKRSLEKHLNDYRRSGVDKDKETRDEITEIRKQMVKASIDFEREIREGTKFVDFAEEDLEGLPKDFIDSHLKTEEGKIRISTDYPDFFPVVNYARKEATRKAIYQAFLQRAWPANEKNLMDILNLRFRFAQLLGYRNWADYAAELEMAKDADTIGQFIDQVADIARPRMQKDLDELLQRKRQDVPETDGIHVWDRFYYVNQIKSERFDIDMEALRQYFPFQQVVDGVLKINQLIFGVTFTQVSDETAWHPDVLTYDVSAGNRRIGRFYLDMHPREGKYKHMAMFHIVEGIRGNRLPVGALVCNFPKPGDSSEALMSHSEVETLFHEFGHLMHHILAGGYPWMNLTGISCESEFVEAPSQLLEEWAYAPEVLKQFAKHVKTGEAIPDDEVMKLVAARKFGKGIHVMRQMFYAAISLQFHRVPTDDLNLLALTRQLQEQYNPYPYEPDTYVYASFGHLMGYTSEYYSYMWSLKLARDLLTRFEREGMLNPATAADYREKIIRRGGSEDANEMVKEFLGRESNFDAFKKYLEN